MEGLIVKKQPLLTKSDIVTLVIAGRNSEPFLKETIESCFNQSVPCPIIYSDDSSYDNSLNIALSYVEKGLVVLPFGDHKGVCATRNRGAIAATTPYIIFVDSDDVLPRDYVLCMLNDLKAANRQVPFIYPSTQCFQDAETRWDNLEWSKYDKWRQNQVSTTAMWNKGMFMGAGQWQDLPTMWDYDLALRMCVVAGQENPPLAGKAVLKYRIHPDSQSSLLNERFKMEAIPFMELIRRRNATVGIGSIISGRLANLFPKWISKLSQSIRYGTWMKKPKLHLLLHTNAQKHLHFFSECVQRYSNSFDSISFGFINDEISHVTEFARRQSVCRFMAKACQTIQDTLMTDLVWLIEDDIIVPMRAYESLYLSCTKSDDPPIGVSGVYYNRHPGLTDQLLGGWIHNGNHCEPKIHFRDEDVVDFVGTGCLMYWRDRPGSPKKWKPLTEKRQKGTTAHDWAWSEDVNGYLFINGTVDCEHYISETEFV